MDEIVRATVCPKCGHISRDPGFEEIMRRLWTLRRRYQELRGKLAALEASP